MRGVYSMAMCAGARGLQAAHAHRPRRLQGCRNPWLYERTHLGMWCRKLPASFLSATRAAKSCCCASLAGDSRITCAWRARHGGMHVGSAGLA